ncbi:hypothetical protein TIFTF001_031392 [Ficus carica]|uniref:Uncharacterized protein n=1 Tax=Ficus carica TaxID=3494 RepID=A0AA88DWB3_FICCA|nr:hypothetical protein TIFTF001_031392 [Ficus carica]
MATATVIGTATKLFPPLQRRASTHMSSPRSIELPPAKRRSPTRRHYHLWSNLADSTPLTQTLPPVPKIRARREKVFRL